MRYIQTSQEDLTTLMKGLEILERIDPEITRQLDICLYGVTNDQSLLDAAREAIAAENEESGLTENDVQVSEIGLAIPLSADTIYALLGSGIKVNDKEFVYKTDGGEGTRTGYFYEANYSSAKVSMQSLTTLALADTDSWLDEFFTKEAKGTPAHIERKVQRSQTPATQATAPDIDLEGPPQAAPAPPPVPKQTSLRGGPKLADFLEELLG